MLKINRSLVDRRTSSFFPSSSASLCLSSSHVSRNYCFKHLYTGHGKYFNGNKNDVLNGFRKTNFNSILNQQRSFTHVQGYSTRSFINSTSQISHRSWREKLTAEYLDSLNLKELLSTCSIISKLNFNTQNNPEQSAICLQLAYRIMEFDAMSRSDFYSFFYSISNCSLVWSNFPENIQDKIFLFLYKAVPQLKPQQLVVLLSSCSRLQMNWYNDFYSEIQQVIEQYILQKANKLSFHDKKGIAMQLDKLGFDILDSENSTILNALWIVSSDSALNAHLAHSDVSVNSNDHYKSNIISNTIANSTTTMTIEQQQPQQHRTNNRNSTADTKISDSHLKTPLLRDHYKGVPIPMDGNSFISRKTNITKSKLNNTNSNTMDSASNNINISAQNITHIDTNSSVNKNKQNTKLSYTANKSAKYLLTTTKNNEKYSLYYDTNDNGSDTTDNNSAAVDNISDNQTANSLNSSSDTAAVDTFASVKHKNMEFRNLYLVMQNSIDNGHIPLFVTTLCKYIDFVNSVEQDNGKIVYYALKIVHLLTGDNFAAVGKMNINQLLILLDSLHKIGIFYVDAHDTDSGADISVHRENTATSADNNNDSVNNSSGSSDINSYSHATNALFETILTRILALHTGIDSSTNIVNLTDLSVTSSTDVTNSNANSSSVSNNTSNNTSNSNSNSSGSLTNVQIIELFQSLANCNVNFLHLSPTLQHNLLSLLTPQLITALDLYKLNEILQSLAKLEVVWGDLLPTVQNSFLATLSNCMATGAARSSDNNCDDSSNHSDNATFINTRLSLLQSLGTIDCFNMSSLAQYNQPLVVDLTMSLMNDIQKYTDYSGNSSGNSNSNSDSVSSSGVCSDNSRNSNKNEKTSTDNYHTVNNSKLSLFLSLLDAIIVVQWRYWAMSPAVREKLCDTLHAVLSEQKSSLVGTAKLIDRLGGLRIPYTMFSSDIQTILERDIRAAAPVLTNAHRKNMFFGLVYMGWDKNILGGEDQVTRIEQRYIAKVNKSNQTDTQKLAKIQIYLQMKFNAALIMPTLTPLLPSLPYRYIEQLAHYIDLSNNPATSTTVTTATFRRTSATTESTTTATRRRRVSNTNNDDNTDYHRCSAASTARDHNIWAIDEDEEEIYTVKNNSVYRNRMKEQQEQKLEEQHEEEQEEEDPETRFNREVYDFDMDYVRGNNVYKYDD